MRSLSLLALLLLTSTADAQVREGLVELGGTASFTSTEGFTVINFSPTIGYFLTPALEAGVDFDYFKVENADGDGFLTVFAAYHFGGYGARTVPFIQAEVGTSITDESDLVFGGSGGGKFFFAPGGALVAEGFLLTTGEVTTVGAAAGVSIFF